MFRLTFLALTCCFSFFANAQEVLPACPGIKDGTFYSYPANSNDQWKSIRAGDQQQKINLLAGDTVLFKAS